MTPVPGSFQSTRSRRKAPSSVPSAVPSAFEIAEVKIRDNVILRLKLEDGGLVPKVRAQRATRAIERGAVGQRERARMARRVLPGGRVYATDIQPEMIAILRTNMTARGVTNVEPVLGTTLEVRLPTNSVDLAIMVDVYHEFDHPFEMIEAMVAALKPGGRIVFVEFRGEDPNVPIKTVHKMTEEQVKKEMSVHALVHDRTGVYAPAFLFFAVSGVGVDLVGSQPP